MYDQNYYPTPRTIIEKMLEPYMANIKKMNILEPSAGMGAIADYLRYSPGVKQSRIYCCEYNPEMKAALIGKGYKVVQDDFLTYSGSMSFDLIVMNPPFDRGVDHLLKAWEIMRNGDIVCLLNYETLQNPYTEKRQQLLDIVERHGSFENLGQVFGDAARKTNVEVALVRLTKTTQGSAASFQNVASTTKMQDIDLTSSGNGVQKNDYVKALIRSYEMAVQSTEDLYKAMLKFKLYVDTFAGTYDAQKLCNQFFETSQKEGYSEGHNEFVLALQRHAWNTVFSNTRMSGLITTKVRKKFDDWREQQGGADLNEPNVIAILDMVVQQRNLIAMECILDVFDKITYHSEKNRQGYGETWKTNSHYMVPEKFILPYIVEARWSNGLSLNYRAGETLDDIDRAMCLLTGDAFEEITTLKTAIENWCSDKVRGPEESTFFTFKCHLKGTVHFKFKDKKLQTEFNRRACEGKGWQLPDEEKFHGKNRRQ